MLNIRRAWAWTCTSLRISSGIYCAQEVTYAGLCTLIDGWLSYPIGCSKNSVSVSLYDGCWVHQGDERDSTTKFVSSCGLMIPISTPSDFLTDTLFSLFLLTSY